MSAVIVVFFVWFAIVTVLGIAVIGSANRLRAPAWCHELSDRTSRVAETSVSTIGRIATGLLIALAGWSVVIIVGWLLGVGAHHIENKVDHPAFNWWQDHHLSGSWHDAWWKLTNIGSPDVTQALTFAGMVVLALLYMRRPQWWVPSVILGVSYVAEKYSQTILKLVVDRGHPPTTLGSWPSGGMGRLVDVYGLIIYFAILRFWPASRRMWAIGGTLLAFAASIQAYARINNLEHWLTDVIGGFVFGVLLLSLFVLVHRGMTNGSRTTPPQPTSDPLDSKPIVRSSNSGGAHRASGGGAVEPDPPADTASESVLDEQSVRA